MIEGGREISETWGRDGALPWLLPLLLPLPPTLLCLSRQLLLAMTPGF